ncbi:MAG: ATP-binding cassette domain-containing protein [Candidatus Bipolaricaulota bacterium]
MTDTALKICNVSKAFPGVQALGDVSFAVRRGEVHAVVGENGAGKSTLMKILAGAQAPDGGAVFIGGTPMERFTPEEARRAGVAIIYQEFNLVQQLSVAKNIDLGREPHRWGWILRRKERRRARQTLSELGAELPLRRRVSRLSVAEQQLVEIAKALSQDARILIMDEPASALSLEERERLFGLVEKLKARGLTIVYVSHHLEEVFRLADRVTVFKDGCHVATAEAEATNRDEVITWMVGRKLENIFPPRGKEFGDSVLTVDGLSSPPRVKDVSLTLRRGEIVGLYGLVGAGRTELCQALFGARPSQGAVSVKGRPARIRSPWEAVRRGMAFLTENRKEEGLVLGLSVRHNLALPSLSQRQRASVIQQRAEQRSVQEVVHKLGIRVAGTNTAVLQLSGGNQQKVVIGKWLLARPDVLICDEPTRGVDVGAKAEIYAHLRRLADQGMAILMVSSELPEMLGMSDRVLVMRDGAIAAALPIDQATEERVLSKALGEREEEEGGIGTRESDRSWGERGRHALRRVASSGRHTEAIVLGALLALFVAGAFSSPMFLSSYNLTSILRYAVALGLVSVGQAVAMQAGGVDLSVGATITLSSIVAAGLMGGNDAMIVPAVLAAVGVGLAVGTINGLAVVGLRIAPFIATLGVMSVARGVVLLITRGSIGAIGPAFRSFSRGSVGPLPAALFILVVAFALATLLMNRTRYGRHVFALGGSSEVARLAGIRARSLLFSTFWVSGVCAAVAGLYLTSRMGSGDPSVGPGFELDSITAVLIGGIPFGGGRGNVVGVIAGVMLLAVLSNLLNMWNLSSWYYQIARAAVLLAAIAVVKTEG